jgi:hypothetical protein
MADTMKQVLPEQLHFPAVPHWKTGVKCNGSIVAEQNGEHVTLKCNECAAVVGTVNIEILKALEQAIADQFVIHKFSEADAPDVLTSISAECQRGECNRCPGVFRRDDTGEESIFCIHSCHEISDDSERPIN